MRCEEVCNYASEYIDRQLDDETRDGVVLHLSRCAECAAHVDDLRAMIVSIGGLSAPEPPEDLFDRTLLALDRESEPEMTIITRRHFRLRPHYTGNLVQIAKQILVDYEFKLIAYSIGLVLTFGLFGGVLASMRPLMSLSPFMSPSQHAVWMSPVEARVLGSFATVHSLPRIAATSELPETALTAAELDNLVILAEINPDGRGEIVQVLSHPADAQAVGRLAVAMNQPHAFVPAYAVSGRPIPSRVVLFVERMDILG